jgi:hypothetical protein
VAEEIGGEYGVSPGSVVDADLLEEPAGIGAVAVSHVNGAFEFRAGGIQWKEALCEDLAVWCFEI